MISLKECVVSDASPIISLERIPKGHLYLSKLFSKVYVPEKAMFEITRKPPRTFEDYKDFYNISEIIEVVNCKIDRTISDIDTLFDFKKDNDYEGEAYALSFAIQNGFRVLLDDKKPIAIAKKNGIKFYNLGTYTLRAYKKFILSIFEAEEMLENFKNANIYSEADYLLYRQILLNIDSK